MALSARTRLVALALAAPLLLGGACGDQAEGVPAAQREAGDRFDSGRAFADLRRQVALGPRPAGSEASRRLADRLQREVPRGRFEEVPGGLRNVVGVLPGRGPAIVIAAHYDTKDIPGFVGANDGASGTAAVLELSRVLRPSGARRGREVRFVFFDGEESPGPEESSDFLNEGVRGSRAYAKAHAAEIGALVLLDFVGDKSLSLPHEEGSDPALWRQLRAAARRAGVIEAFPGSSRPEILDDHTPFSQAGVPAIDLLDFPYHCFHLTCDNLSQVSARSLDKAGEAVAELLRGGIP